jgi:hypothetical protein
MYSMWIGEKNKKGQTYVKSVLLVQNFLGKTDPDKEI